MAPTRMNAFTRHHNTEYEVDRLIRQYNEGRAEERSNADTLANAKEQNQKIEDVISSIPDFESTVVSLKKEVGTWTPMENRVRKAKGILAETSGRLQKMTQFVVDREQEAVRAENTIILKKIIVLMDKNGELEMRQKEQTDEIRRLESANEKLTNDMDLERRESTDSLLTRGSIEVLRTHRENQKKELAALRTQQDEQRPELMALRKQKKEQEEEVAALRTQQDEQRPELVALRKQKEEQEEELTALRTQQDEQRPELVALRKQKEEQEEEVAALHAQCLKREQEVLALYTQRDKQAQVLETLRTQWSEEEQEVVLVRAERDKHVEKRNKLRTQRDKERQRIDTLMTKRSQQDADIETLRAAIDSQFAVRDEQEKELDGLRAAIDSQHAVRDNQAKELVTVGKSLEVLAGQRQEQNQRVADLREECSALNTEALTLEADLQRKRTVYTDTKATMDETMAEIDNMHNAIEGENGVKTTLYTFVYDFEEYEQEKKQQVDKWRCDNEGLVRRIRELEDEKEATEVNYKVLLDASNLCEDVE